MGTCAEPSVGAGSVFLSRFWVSKWHPKILQRHLKFWKPRYGFAMYWSETNWGKHAFLHVATATDGCNRMLGICALSWAPSSFSLLLYGRRFVQCGVRNCENTLLQLWKCFTVSPLLSACLVMHQTTMKTWASEGGGRGAWPPLDFEIISKRGCFFNFEGWKPNFTTFGTPWKKFWENPQVPPWKKEKILPTPMNEDKRPAVAVRMQNKVVVECGNSES